MQLYKKPDFLMKVLYGNETSLSSGEERTKYKYIIYSRTRGRAGSKKPTFTFYRKFEGVSERIIVMRLNTDCEFITLIAAYDPKLNA